uniref:Uncharacterized protein n=1 Tax=Romanomermis culicivorax TaxID=13658 RepID=A0A915I3Q9_ROMCU
MSCSADSPGMFFELAKKYFNVRGKAVTGCLRVSYGNSNTQRWYHLQEETGYQFSPLILNN